MIKKRSRPQPRTRDVSPERDASTPENMVERQADEPDNIPIAELIELRKLKKAQLKQGIDAEKLNKGDIKKRKRPVKEEQGGLQPGAGSSSRLRDDEDEALARARKAVRTNNFTQQTNALDVDKHMMQYIEENLQIRSKPREETDYGTDYDHRDAMNYIAERLRTEKEKAAVEAAAKEKEKTIKKAKTEREKGEEGSVTNSIKMLTAIPEVDLGMDTRLKNIEDTEKAKKIVAEIRAEKAKNGNADEAHLSKTLFYQPNLRVKSDADILRDAKLEAMGLQPQSNEGRSSNHERPQMATDEMVMEKFKKRMRQGR